MKPSGIYVTCDIVIFTTANKKLHLLLIKRKNPPFKNKWALPGGFVEIDEDLKDTAARELYEETGLKNIKMYQFHTFGRPDRDPRGRTITVAYLAYIPYKKINLRSGSDAKEAALFQIDKLPELAFDHKKIVRCAVKHLLSKYHRLKRCL